MSGGAPTPPDFQGLAQQQANVQNQQVAQQTQANRPNQSNPYASSTWQQGPNGQWSQSTQFNGPLAGANASLQQQAASNYTSPFSLAGLPAVGTGEDARNQAITSAYGQATSRLDPQWNQRGSALRTQLLNQGLQPGSEAYDKAMANFGQQQNDAYSSAMANAIGQGTAAGSAIFGQNLAGRQQGVNEASMQYNMPMQQLQAMNGLTGMSGFSQAGQGMAPQLLQAGGMQNQANFQNWQANNQQLSDWLGAGMQLAGTAGSLAMMSDERAKVDLERHPVEVVPGVPLATFRYHPNLGIEGHFAGVSAQDLQKVHPEHVRERPDGLLEVSHHFAPKRIG